jgi:hypothetical protein
MVGYAALTHPTGYVEKCEHPPDEMVFVDPARLKRPRLGRTFLAGMGRYAGCICTARRRLPKRWTDFFLRRYPPHDGQRRIGSRCFLEPNAMVVLGKCLVGARAGFAAAVSFHLHGRRLAIRANAVPAIGGLRLSLTHPTAPPPPSCAGLFPGIHVFNGRRKQNPAMTASSANLGQPS